MTIKSTRFLLRFVLAAILASGIGLRAHAHELATTELRNETFAQGCFESEFPALAAEDRTSEHHLKGSAPVFRGMAPLTSSYSAAARLLSTAANEYRSLVLTQGLLRGYIATATQHAASFWKASPKASNHKLVHSPTIEIPLIQINAPDEGVPPSPQFAPAVALQQVTPVYVRSKKQFTEDYLPYDLAMRDWRVGFSYRESTSTAVNQVALHEPPQQLPAEVAAWFANAAEFLGNKFISQDLLSEWTENATKGLNRKSNQVFGVVTEQVAKWHTQPYFATPSYVLHEMPDGSKYLFTREQAEAYNLSIARVALPMKTIDERATGLAGCPVFRTANQWVNSTIAQFEQSLEDSLKKALKGSLASTTARVDYLAKWLNNFSVAEVAGRSSETLR